jgi:PleD family two-component response regulator
MLSTQQKTKSHLYEPMSPSLWKSHSDNAVVLMVNDQEDGRAELKQMLELSGYRVIETDNGQDAAKRARFIPPDLVLIDLGVPLLYELVAARQIVKSARLGSLPIVLVTREDSVDQGSMMEVGVRSNEYVTRLDDYIQLEHLLDYLLPIGRRRA